MTRAAISQRGDDVALFERFLEMRDELDDVQRVFHMIELGASCWSQSLLFFEGCRDMTLIIERLE